MKYHGRTAIFGVVLTRIWRVREAGKICQCLSCDGYAGGFTFTCLLSSLSLCMFLCSMVVSFLASSAFVSLNEKRGVTAWMVAGVVARICRSFSAVRDTFHYSIMMDQVPAFSFSGEWFVSIDDGIR